MISKEDLDWIRSPEAAREGVSPDEVRVWEGLWARKEALVAKIRLVFAGVRLGDGIGLLEADGQLGPG